MKKSFKTRMFEVVDIASIPFKESGAGDAISSIAQPIAERIDSIQGTQLRKCSGCAASKRGLNFEAEKGVGIV